MHHDFALELGFASFFAELRIDLINQPRLGDTILTGTVRAPASPLARARTITTAVSASYTGSMAIAHGNANVWRVHHADVWQVTLHLQLGIYLNCGSDCQFWRYFRRSGRRHNLHDGKFRRGTLGHRRDVMLATATARALFHRCTQDRRRRRRLIEGDFLHLLGRGRNHRLDRFGADPDHQQQGQRVEADGNAGGDGVALDLHGVGNCNGFGLQHQRRQLLREKSIPEVGNQRLEWIYRLELFRLSQIRPGVRVGKSRGFSATAKGAVSVAGKRVAGVGTRIVALVHVRVDFGRCDQSIRHCLGLMVRRCMRRDAKRSVHCL